MKVYVIGDHSKYHAGCEAVTNVLRQKISVNHEIFSAPYGLSPQVDEQGLAACDALVVNGEGKSASRCTSGRVDL